MIFIETGQNGPRKAFVGFSFLNEGSNELNVWILFAISFSLFSPSDDMPAFNIDMDDDSQLMVINPRKRVTRQLTEPEELTIVRDRDDEFQIMRHVILLLALSSSMFVVSWLESIQFSWVQWKAQSLINRLIVDNKFKRVEIDTAYVNTVKGRLHSLGHYLVTLVPSNAKRS